MDWNSVQGQIKQAVGIFAPLIEAAVPSAAPAAAIVAKVIAGVAAAEPAAVALYHQIVGIGPDPTAEELAAFAAYEGDYQALHADIAAKRSHPLASRAGA